MNAACIATVAIVGLGPTRARADEMPMIEMPSTSIAASVSVLTARYDTSYYIGDYQGVTPAVHAMHGRWSAMAMLGLYRLDENGRTLYGLGDPMASGSMTLVDAHAWRAGITAGAMIPIGDQPTGFGMGHVMLMPAAWLAASAGPLTLRASVGYGRAITDLSGHDHGPWPLVDPMNMQEVTWGASASLPVWRRLEATIGGGGAIPFGVAMGVDRIVASARVAWIDTAMVTAVELQAGVIGDPYVVRGVLQMMVTL